MKKNPYDVLGVSSNATDEQIREAYRVLARQYQSDNYVGGNLSDVAAKKMREIDEAYDEIIMLRSSKGNATSYSNESYHNSNERSYRASDNYENVHFSNEYSDVREKIRSGRLDDAEMLLDGVSEGKRSAEWYFLKGSIQNRRGWIEEASANYARACRMDPDNREYRAAYNNLNHSANGGYRTDGKRDNGCNGCNVCSSLVCADCCCELMGGDLIRCC